MRSHEALGPTELSDSVAQFAMIVARYQFVLDEGTVTGFSIESATDLPTFANRTVSLIDATGNVIIQRGDKRATSKKAVYHQRDETLVLTGDPEAWEEGYRVTGTKMTMFLREDRSIVEGGSRVVINERESKPR